MKLNRLFFLLQLINWSNGHGSSSCSFSSATNDDIENVCTSDVVVTREDEDTILNTNLNRVRLKQSEHNTNSTGGSKSPYSFHCDRVIAEIPPEDILSAFNVFREKTKDKLSNVYDLKLEKQVKFGVRIKTVCASCKTAVSDSISSNNSMYNESFFNNNEAFNRYCGPGVYGHNIVHSGAVMIPLVRDLAGNLIEKPGSNIGFVQSRSTRTNRYDIPSHYSWLGKPKDYRENFLSFLATTTKGAISILPDFMGFGISTAMRGYILRNPYVTATLPLWLKVSSQLSKETNGLSTLDNAAIFNGYSEGGSASIAIAEGFHSALNIKVVKVIAGGGALALVNVVMNSIRNVDNGLLNRYLYLCISFGASYSSTNPDVPNHNKGQDLINPKYTNSSNLDQNFLAWSDEADATGIAMNQRMNVIIEGIIGSRIAEFWNPALVHYFKEAMLANESDPCSLSYSKYKLGTSDKFCEALSANDLLDIASNASYPIEYCHSVDDQLCPFDGGITDTSHNPDYLTLIKETGNHYQGSITCLSRALSYFVSEEFLNYTSTSENTLMKHETVPLIEESTCNIEEFIGRTFYLPAFSSCWKIELFPHGVLDQDKSDSDCSNETFNSSNGDLSMFDKEVEGIYHFRKGNLGWIGQLHFKESKLLPDAKIDLKVDEPTKRFLFEMTLPSCSKGSSKK